MECTFEELGDVLVIGFDGRFVAACVEETRELVSKRLEGVRKVVFDLSKMTHIDSSGLGLLVYLLKRIKSNDGVVRLAALQQHPRMVFDITKTYRLFDIDATREESLAALGAAR